MIDVDLEITLPSPWYGQSFELAQVGPINFLVGPNGSGKSQFARALAPHLLGSRFLGTDRLSGMEQVRPLADMYGEHFSGGLPKNQFDNFRQSEMAGLGIGTLVLLEERIELRIQVEAVLSHLFHREINLEWDSGNLVAMVRRRGDNVSYRLDREECHGIKELCVLLTHLYDDEHQSLIIDEPELNLHPQYQAFFMHEVRKVAGDPGGGGKKKLVFLITHSPFILDFKSPEDLRSVMSFSLDYSIPKRLSATNAISSSTTSLIKRLNAYQKQLFFADNPIFVEGILDAQMVTALMEARGFAVEAAGSCIIEAGGAEEVNHYLNLCLGFGKDAHFLYDLDSLFSGNLRSCIKDDETVQSFLATAGLGGSFARYCGDLDKALKPLIDQLRDVSLPTQLEPLGDYLMGLGEQPWESGKWGKARTAVMTAISRHREQMAAVLSETAIADIEGRRNQVIGALEEKSIHVLPGGTLERYLPSYAGGEYQLNENAKSSAVQAEVQNLASPTTDCALAERYGDLYHAVRSLPSNPDVDIEPTIRNYLSDYIHELQKTAVNNPDWEGDQIQQRLAAVQPGTAGVFSLRSFERDGNGAFLASIEVTKMLDQRRRSIQVSDKTNAGMGDFTIETDQEVSTKA